MSLSCSGYRVTAETLHWCALSVVTVLRAAADGKNDETHAW